MDTLYIQENKKLLLQFLVVFHVHRNVEKASRESSCDGLGIKNREQFCFVRPPLGRWMDNGGRKQQSTDSIINQQVS